MSCNASYSGFKAVSGGIARSINGCGVGHIALGQVIVVVVVVVVTRRGASTTIAIGRSATLPHNMEGLKCGVAGCDKPIDFTKLSKGQKQRIIKKAESEWSKAGDNKDTPCFVCVKMLKDDTIQCDKLTNSATGTITSSYSSNTSVVLAWIPKTPPHRGLLLYHEIFLRVSMSLEFSMNVYYGLV